MAVHFPDSEDSELLNPDMLDLNVISFCCKVMSSQLRQLSSTVLIGWNQITRSVNPVIIINTTMILSQLDMTFVTTEPLYILISKLRTQMLNHHRPISV
jgi:hypothetical protein